MDVASWLRNLGLGRYEAAFRENGVRAEVLCHLAADNPKERGVTAALSSSASRPVREISQN